MGLGLSRLTLLLGYGIALLGALSLFSHIPLLPRLVLLVGLVAGLIGERRTKPLLPHMTLTIASVLLFAWYAAQFSRANPALPVVSILTVLLGTRLAAEKTPRTWLQTCAIALFCLAASSLFDLGPRFLLLLSAMLPLIALMLVLLTFQSHNQQLPRDSLRSLVLIGLTIPLTALILTPLFFPILPRTQLPLWNFIQQAGGSQPSGLADTVTPGATAQVPSSGQLVFRAELPRLAPGQLYWRGPTFSRLNELQWQKDPAAASAARSPGGATVHQVITMEPGAGRALIGLDMPLSFTDQTGRSIPFGTWNRPLPTSRRLRYEVLSAIAGPSARQPPTALFTQLPDATPARLRQLAARLRQPNASDRQRLQALEDWFRTSGFRYSRSDLPTGDDALERFLFETRSGHCEFFASGFALLARGAGLPTRLVGGYYGGEYNELGGYYRVGEERAHVWVEVWLNGAGWQRVDPSSMAVNADAVLGEPRQRSLTLRIRLLLDSMDHAWNSTIITYDFERQLQIASQAHSRLQALGLKELKRFVPMLAVILAAGALYVLLPRLLRNDLFDRRRALLRSFRRAMERDHGIPRTSPVGLLDIERQVNNPRVSAFIDLYARSLYRDQPLSRSEYLHLRRMLKSGFAAVKPNQVTPDNHATSP